MEAIKISKEDQIQQLQQQLDNVSRGSNAGKVLARDNDAKNKEKKCIEKSNASSKRKSAASDASQHEIKQINEKLRAMEEEMIKCKYELQEQRRKIEEDEYQKSDMKIKDLKNQLM